MNKIIYLLKYCYFRNSFDSVYYINKYPDLRELASDEELIKHYICHGKEEGRYRSLQDEKSKDKTHNLNQILKGVRLERIKEGGGKHEIIEWGNRVLSRERETVLIVSHECSNTGCPILSKDIAIGFSKKFNVIFITFGQGPLLSILPSVSNYGFSIPLKFRHNKGVIFSSLQKYLQTNVKFALVNSLESRFILEPLAKLMIPSVCCIHEYAWNYEKKAFQEVLIWSNAIVFSSSATLESAKRRAENNFANAQIVPQGYRPITELDVTNSECFFHNTIHNLKEKGFSIVVGAGFGDYRKGFDLFWLVSKRIKESLPKRKIKFVWIGDYASQDMFGLISCSSIEKFHLENDVLLPGFIKNCQELYRHADLLLLTSRMDPLPTTVIEAGFASLPFICFDATNGYVELLDQLGLSERCVARELDAYHMASLAVELLKSEILRQDVALRLGREVPRIFNMPNYLDKLQNCGAMAIENAATSVQRINSIGVEGKPFVYLDFKDRKELEIQYREAIAGCERVKPAPGCFPSLTCDTVKDRSDAFIRGLTNQWRNYPTFELQHREVKCSNITKIALHIHAYYLNEFRDILKRLARNSFCPALFVSTSAENIESIESLLYQFGFVAVVRLTPNIGRDVAPFFSLFKDELSQYEIIGHVHTKESLHVPSYLVKSWNNVCLSNTIGNDAGGVISEIVQYFENHEQCGLIFPDDVHTVGWTENKNVSIQLLQKLGINIAIPERIVFPIGMMFWARYKSLQPFFELLDWSDYPPEPIGNDGTILHAIERLLPTIAKHQGFKYATTYTSGVIREM